jgi:NADH pyrophosphatase NudC (nudix superfamily)
MVQSLAYSGGFLDRASARRSDPGWVGALLDAPRTRLIPIWRDHCLVSGDPPAPVTSLDGGRGKLVREVSTPLFLGLDGDAGLFAADLSPLQEARAIEVAGAERVGDPRAFAGTVSAAEAAILAYARGLVYWNRHQQFCGTCGAVEYVAFQAWPFPAGLMVGFRATAAGESVAADGQEAVEARWFTHAELAQRAASGRPLGRVDSIDRYLLRSWLNQA